MRSSTATCPSPASRSAESRSNSARSEAAVEAWESPAPASSSLAPERPNKESWPYEASPPPAPSARADASVEPSPLETRSPWTPSSTAGDTSPCAAVSSNRPCAIAPNPNREAAITARQSMGAAHQASRALREPPVRSSSPADARDLPCERTKSLPRSRIRRATNC